MASPHVAGAAALYLQGKLTATSPKQVRDALVANATTVSTLKDSFRSPTKLLFSNY